MIRRLILSVLMGSSMVLSQSGTQPKLRVDTLVREDLFAGYLFNDMERFESGVKKLEQMLRENPENASALGWRASSELFRAVKAREEGKEPEFRNSYLKSLETLEKALKVAPKYQGVLATMGASLIFFADRLPEEQRIEAYKKGRSLFKELVTEQKPFLDQLPLHMRGELLAGLAQAAARLGDSEEAQVYLKQIVSSLPDTPYERKAKKWLDQPESAKDSSLVCQTCHEPGRLENVLRAQTRP